VEPAWRDAQGEIERRVWSAVLRPAAVELDEHAAELSRAVVPYISERMPGVVDSAEAWEARRASNEASIRGFAKVLQSGADPVDAATLGSATLAFVRDGAKRGVPASVLLRSYRLAHAGTARHLYAILANHAADAEELSLAIDLCSAWLFAYVDAVVCLGEDQRERAMKRFTSPGHAQRFLSAFSGISPHFRPGRHRLTAPEWRTEMADRFTVWRVPSGPERGAEFGAKAPVIVCPYLSVRRDSTKAGESGRARFQRHWASA
jgi:hypothetical protein